MTTPQDLLNILRNQSHRITSVRKNLIKIFCEVNSPLSAPDLAKQLEGSAHKTTLYRELQFLVDQKIIKEVNFGDQIKRYELSGQKHHHHAICINCKKVEDVATPDLCLAEAEVVKQTGFTKIKHSLEFFGLCQKCSS